MKSSMGNIFIGLLFIVLVLYIPVSWIIQKVELSFERCERKPITSKKPTSVTGTFRGSRVGNFDAAPPPNQEEYVQQIQGQTFRVNEARNTSKSLIYNIDRQSLEGGGAQIVDGRHVERLYWQKKIGFEQKVLADLQAYRECPARRKKIVENASKKRRQIRYTSYEQMPDGDF